MKYFNKAIDVAEEGGKRYPDDSDILVTLSNAYIAANKVDVAIEAFKKGVAERTGQSILPDTTTEFYCLVKLILPVLKNNLRKHLRLILSIIMQVTILRLHMLSGELTSIKLQMKKAT